MERPKQDTFLEKYHLTTLFEKAEVDWNALIQIFDDYVDCAGELQATAAYIADRLRPVREVHSLMFRIKDAEHLLEKIIRKKAAAPDLDVTIDTYRERITDLVGVRALHLFKEEWPTIHDSISTGWDLFETPTANVRRGDPDELTQMFRDKGCEINEHPFGYRSVHYIVRSQPSRKVVLAEIQVRTIFEEGWSEIDHRIRYPYDQDNLVLSQFLVIFNRLAGSADEMGSFIRFLKSELDKRESEHDLATAAHEKLIQDLKVRIQKLEIGRRQKVALDEQLQTLELVRPLAVSGETGAGKTSLLNFARLFGLPLEGLSALASEATAGGTERVTGASSAVTGSRKRSKKKSSRAKRAKRGTPRR